MVVLIVDDQTNVVSGLISGINWDRIHVTKVWKAYNAFEARNILENQSVDIMLCDIEMPAEDGLSLLRWVKKQNLKIESILLTAHADFMYAKEAVQLGVFDYIIQPARYEDIEAAILQAENKIMSNRKKQEYTTYGQIMFEKKSKLIDSILNDWFYHRDVEVTNILSDFQKLEIQIDQKSRVYPVLIQVLRWLPKSVHWETQLLKASLQNILAELFEPYGQSILLTQKDHENYLLIVYNRNNQLVDEEGLIRKLEDFIRVCMNFFGCSISCYTMGAVPPSELPQESEKLLSMQHDNVTLASKVFFYHQNYVGKKEEMYDLFNMKHWANTLAGGGVSTVRHEALAYLKKLSDAEQLNAEGLKRFYQSFIQMLFHAAEQQSIPLYRVFQDKDTLDKSLNSYNTVDDMYDFINLSLDLFEKEAKANVDTKSQIDMVIQYIHNNIEKDIRRNDIAEAVYLNPDYLSRLFKKEVGIQLKEYITQCKMKEAQSLLRTTSLPISMIALKVGYTNFSHFSQVYKKLLGMTPAEDRNN